MAANSNTRRLIVAIIFLCAGALINIVNFVLNFVTVTDFIKGFLEGIGLALSVFGIITLFTYFIRYKKTL